LTRSWTRRNIMKLRVLSGEIAFDSSDEFLVSTVSISSGTSGFISGFTSPAASGSTTIRCSGDLSMGIPDSSSFPSRRAIGELGPLSGIPRYQEHDGMGDVDETEELGPRPLTKGAEPCNKGGGVS
ncbi:hypothetical protein PFISCL1PPCAC_26574, partial [Pristionchus fissidentatus]